mgnify:CR=1 FL=1
MNLTCASRCIYVGRGKTYLGVDCANNVRVKLTYYIIYLTYYIKFRMKKIIYFMPNIERGGIEKNLVLLSKYFINHLILKGKYIN